MNHFRRHHRLDELWAQYGSCCSFHHHCNRVAREPHSLRCWRMIFSGCLHVLAHQDYWLSASFQATWLFPDNFGSLVRATWCVSRLKPTLATFEWWWSLARWAWTWGLSWCLSAWVASACISPHAPCRPLAATFPSPAHPACPHTPCESVFATQPGRSKTRVYPLWQNHLQASMTRVL